MSQANTLKALHDEHLQQQQQQQKQALESLQLLQQLNDNEVSVSVFGESLASQSINQFIAHHQNNNLSLADTVEVFKQLVDAQVQMVKVDIGQLSKADESVADAVARIKEESSNKPAVENPITDVVLYGFGRIGRILTRLMVAESANEQGLQLKAVVVRPAKAPDLFKRVALLLNDSVHGKLDGSATIDEENNAIIVNGRMIQVIYANSPSEVDYTAYGIDNALIIDNTGIWSDEEGLGQHLQAKGASKVLLTAPAKGDVKNIVYNVNNDTIGDDKIVSAASCTTNAITPTLKVLNDKYGVRSGHVETIHAFTNDQNLIDNFHKKDRRGRAAPLNMVITSTGAAKAVGKALPELNGKLTGNAIRVPTPNVSMAILNLSLENAPTNSDELNAFLLEVANSNKWQLQIGYSNSTEAVSSDFVGAKKVGIIDAQATILTDNNATVYVWYDNEMGYSTQVLRVAEQMAGRSYSHIPSLG